MITLAHWEGKKIKNTGQRAKSASRPPGNPMASPRLSVFVQDNSMSLNGVNNIINLSSYNLGQGCQIQLLEGHSPAYFSFNPNYRVFVFNCLHTFSKMCLFFQKCTHKSKNCTHNIPNTSHHLQNKALHSKYHKHISKANIHLMLQTPLP